jgi:predicted amidohydrolase YtcJ
LGIAIAAQTAMLDWPLEPTGYLQNLLGTRAERFLPLKTMRRLGLRISLGSDAPVTLPEPMVWVHQACNHPNPAESVSVVEALTMLTREAAWMSFDEGQTGSLEAGKSANMVVLSGNPLTTPLQNLKHLRPERLFVEGQPWNGAGTLFGITARALIRGSHGASNLP